MLKQTTKKYLDFINSKFNVLAHTNSVDFDYDYNILENLLAECKQEEFSSNDRILIEFFDTAYYDVKFLKHSILLQNIFTLFRQVDIPFFTILFITNHFGLQEEINSILNNHNDYDRPTIIETFISTLSYDSTRVNEVVSDIDCIRFPALSMIGASRSHRYSLYNYLNENNLLDQVHVSIRGRKE
tara:strand:- start:581 stop:1135 length:555 start_codon:yes stop_codon:yes gene_type:complete